MIKNSFDNLETGWKAGQYEFEKIGIIGKTYQKFDEFRKNFNFEKHLEKLKEKKVVFVSQAYKNYPNPLLKIENPPIGLFVKGNIKLLNHNFKIAAVGTRKITSYGKSITESIVSSLSQSGVCIVSGLALGVDGLSHKICMENGGVTIAVMPCGVDCCLPSENFSIYSEILKNNGLIVSEYPLSQPPNKGTFLARNRIIAALSDGVLVTEAAEDSGSLVTAEYGFTYGKKVFAVPGPINSQMAKGCLKLLKNGANLVTEGKDILEKFEQNKSVISKKKKEIYKSLTKEEKNIVLHLQNEDATIDEISKKTKLPVSKLFVSISNLELKGIIKNDRGKISINN